MDTLSTPLDSIIANTSLLAMWGALIAHWLFPTFRNKSPLASWQILAESLADKVNHAQNTPYQQQLSGALSLSILLVGTCCLLLFFHHFFWIAGVSDSLVLWFALTYKPILDLTQDVSDALHESDKPSARQNLAKYLNRDTLSLSDTGIAKACSEALLLGTYRGLFAVIFWYCIGGAIAALLYTLVAQLARIWSPRLPPFHLFGQATQWLLNGLDWIPVRLFTLLMITGRNLKRAILSVREQAHLWSNPGIGALYAGIGTKYQISFGGAIRYDGHRIERVKIGGHVAPGAYHLDRLYFSVQKKLTMSIIFYSTWLWFLGGSI